ncbi:hypothetical protein [uncultured Jannaschia sp.]|uniref:hypothetical protein n=1 Tax=uncultured Jannaschia sp. TaxID=293347 RepID=UPI00260C59E8|nr:hypothetical protein [uncultured Jannaschia sp.]
MIHRSAAVAVAVTLQQLATGRTSGWTEDQSLVLDALRRSKSSLTQASDAELGAYLRNLSPEQLGGVASNVKGIFHEMLVAQAENMDGDLETASLFEATNQPGADLEFWIEGDLVREVQLKAVQDPASIVEAFSRYPDIDVMATSEVYQAMGGMFAGRLFDSGVSNAEISNQTRETLEALAGESLGDLIQDGVVTSSLVNGALLASAALSGQGTDAGQIRSMLELAGIGAGTALTMDVLLNLV